MLHAILSQLASFWPLIAFFAVIGAAVAVLRARKRRPSREDYYLAQEKRVSAGGFRARPLLNHTESSAYRAIAASFAGTDRHIFAQVNLGEILSHADRQLFNDINTKRVDFLVTDAAFAPLLAIEIHGTGHYQAHAHIRDAIKQKALASAGIDYLAVKTNAKECEQAVASALAAHLQKAGVPEETEK